MDRNPLVPLIGLILLAFAPGLRAVDELPDGLYGAFDTPKGSFVCELEYSKVPLPCINFVGLAEGSLAGKDGVPFYHGLTWYRVVPGFVIQSGNPKLEDTDGYAVPSPYAFPDQFFPGLRHDAAGVLSMGNSGPDTNSCEFFVTLSEQKGLDYLYTPFGHLVRGRDVLMRIAQGDSLKVRILRIGRSAMAFRADQEALSQAIARTALFTGSKEPGAQSRFYDPDHVLGTDPRLARSYTIKLGNFERTTGIPVRIRLFAKSPPEPEDNKAGVYMRKLARELGVSKSGVVIACFADQVDWRVWVGDDVTSRFLGRPASPADLVEDGAFHKVKEAILDGAAAQGDASFEELKKKGGAAATPERHLRLQLDPLVERVFEKLESPGGS